MKTTNHNKTVNNASSGALASDELFFQLAAKHRLLDKAEERIYFRQLDVNLRCLVCLVSQHVDLTVSPFLSLSKQELKLIASLGNRLEQEVELDKALTNRDDDYLCKVLYPAKRVLDPVRQVYPCFAKLKEADAEMSKAGKSSLLVTKLIKQTDNIIELLTFHNLRLVMKVAKQHNFLNLPFMDVVQEGNLGLLKAIEKYTLDQETRFSTYAWWWIKQHITIYVRKQGGIVKKPENVVDRMLKLVREFKSNDDYSDPKTINDIVKRTDFDHTEVQYLLQLAAPDMSFDAPLTNAEDSSFIDTYSDNSMAPDKIEVTEKGLELILDGLSTQARTIITMRYGLDGTGQSSFREIGEAIGKSTERTRQLEQEAMKELQAKVVGARLH